MSDRAIIYRIAGETLLDARSVGRVLRGERVRPATRAAVERAAKRLRITLPSNEPHTPEAA